MAVQPFRSLLGYLRQQVAAPAELTDRQLLQRFIARRDEAAFETLLQRHGPLVWGLCGRLLRHPQDAEDAFQAAFLVLAQKASSIRQHTSLASWLYGVAYRLALKARQRADRRQRHERQAATVRRPESADNNADLRAVLDEELGRLPDKFRAPLVLCYYEGQTNEQAAQALGWPTGSISKRLARGRELLRQRLTRRGVTAPAVLAGAALADASAAAVPAALLRLTGAAALATGGRGDASAAALARGMVREMSLARVKSLFAASLLLGLLTAGLMVAHAALSGGEPARPAVAGAKPGTVEPQQVRVDRLGDPLPPGAVGRLGTTRLRHGSMLYAVAFSPDGKALASAGVRNDDVVLLWDTVTGKELRRFTGHSQPVITVAFSPDGKTLAAGATDGVLRVWDRATGKELQQFPNGGWGLAYSPDSKLLAAVQVNAVVLWDLVTGQSVRRLEEGDVAAEVAFSPDGRTLASSAADDTVRFWDVDTAEERHRLEFKRDGKEFNPTQVWALAFAPDGRTLLLGGFSGAVELWETASGLLRHRFAGHPEAVTTVAFLPDGRTVASGSADTTVLLWDVSGQAARQEQRLSARELAALWVDLAGLDAQKAHQAIWGLVAAPGQAVDELRARLRPKQAVAGGRLQRLLADLDSKQFATRRKAMAELEAMQDLAEPALRKAMTGGLSLEVKQRVGQLLQKLVRLAGPSELLRALRAVEALEQIGTPEARRLLEALAGGAPEAQLTRAARAALRRLGERTAARP